MTPLSGANITPMGHQDQHMEEVACGGKSTSTPATQTGFTCEKPSISTVSPTNTVRHAEAETEAEGVNPKHWFETLQQTKYREKAHEHHQSLIFSFERSIKVWMIGIESIGHHNFQKSEDVDLANYYRDRLIKSWRSVQADFEAIQASCIQNDDSLQLSALTKRFDNLRNQMTEASTYVTKQISLISDKQKVKQILNEPLEEKLRRTGSYYNLLPPHRSQIHYLG